jgi:hypothetical protein
MITPCPGLCNGRRFEAPWTVTVSCCGEGSRDWLAAVAPEEETARVTAVLASAVEVEYTRNQHMASPASSSCSRSPSRRPGRPRKGLGDRPAPLHPPHHSRENGLPKPYAGEVARKVLRGAGGW